METLTASKIPLSWLNEEQCASVASCGHELDFTWASVELFELSGTGMEDVVFAAVRAYLEMLLETKRARDTACNGEWPAAQSLYDHPEHSLAAELAARADLVEYGSSLRFAWIEDKGIAWCVSYDEWKAAEGDE